MVIPTSHSRQTLSGLLSCAAEVTAPFAAAAGFPIGSQFTSYFALSDLNGDDQPEAIVSDIDFSLTVLLNTAHQ